MQQIELKGKSSFGQVALVDDADFDLVKDFRWYLEPRGYVISNQKQKSVVLHRLIMNAPKGKDVDHINHDKLDNTRNNLRVVSTSQNLMNYAKKRTDSSSKYKGVSWNKIRQAWMVRITKDCKCMFIGYFKNEWHGAMAYNLWAKDLFGEFALLNHFYV